MLRIIALNQSFYLRAAQIWRCWELLIVEIRRLPRSRCCLFLHELLDGSFQGLFAVLGLGKPQNAETPLSTKYLVANNFVLCDTFFDRHSPPGQHSCDKSLALLAETSFTGSIKQPTRPYLFRQYNLPSINNEALLSGEEITKVVARQIFNEGSFIEISPPPLIRGRRPLAWLIT